jgi:hypothetical protein
MQSEFLSAAPDLEDALADILLRIVGELRDVAHLIERIEPQLGDLQTEAVEGSLDRMMVLQGIDLAVQKTRSLAEFIGTMTESVPADLMIDVTTALSLVKLTDMKRALGKGVCESHTPPLDMVSGDFEAF